MKEEISNALDHLHATSGRGDLAGVVKAHIINLESYTEAQEDLIKALKNLIENYEKQLSLPWYQRIFLSRLTKKTSDAI